MDHNDEIKFEVIDEDIMFHDLIGVNTFKIVNLVGPQNGMDSWHDLLQSKSKIGKIKLRTEFYPNNSKVRDPVSKQAI